MKHFFLAVSVVLFTTLAATAQEQVAPPKALKATPAVLAQIAETKSVLKTLPVKEQTLMLFQLLSLELQLEDKQPAKNTVNTVLSLIPQEEKEITQTQLLEAAATAQAELGDFTAAVATLDKIAKPFNRAEKQLNVVDFILNKAEETKTPAPDTTGLLHKALTAAQQAKDAGLEAFAAILLARELGKQDKTGEAKPLFQQAVKKIAELEEIEGRNLFALLVRSGIQSGQNITDVLKWIEPVPNAENKLVFTGIAALSLVQNGKAGDGEKITEGLPAGATRDNALMGILQATAKTATPEKIAEYITLASKDEAGKTMRQNAVFLLIQNERYDAAKQLAAQTDYKDKVDDMVFARQLDKLVLDKRYDEAEKLIPSFKDEQNKFQAHRLITISRLKENYSDALINQSAAFLPESDKKEIAELSAEADKAAAVGNADERTAALSGVLQSQFQVFDLQGVRKTLGLMLNSAAAKDPAKQIVERLMLAQVQAELGDKNGVLKNLEQLQIVLDGTKDVSALKGLVPEKPQNAEAENGEASALKLKLPDIANENEIRDHIIEVYLRTADLLKFAGHLPQAKAAFEKAKQTAYLETEPAKKAEKLLALSRFLAELE
ncbi:MAG: hypothetical protein LBN39_12655 [Planctomycetaceae bacterium]|jgi:fumarylacetoacetate (FAA) hydrolase family protein|nr:hypothetical protein [Planctomycetaceae bacterium]